MCVNKAQCFRVMQVNLSVRTEHKLGGSLFQYSSPHMDYQWMLMSILQLSGHLFPKDLHSVALQLDCWIVSEYNYITLSNVSFSLMLSLHQWKPLSFVSFTNCLIIVQLSSRDHFWPWWWFSHHLQSTRNWATSVLGIVGTVPTISDLGNDSILATVIGDFASQSLCG